MIRSHLGLSFTAILFLAGSVSDIAAKPDALEEVTTALAGPGATDCGLAGLSGDRGKVDACVVAAFKSGAPFRARYDILGIDSALSEGVIRSGSGRVFFVKYDSDQGGGSGIGSSVDLLSCPKPSVEMVGASERLVCPSHKGHR